MLELYRHLIGRQYEAALCTLNLCVERCPEANWNAPVGTLKFCQAAFHTLFFADMYLGRDVPSLKEQAFHKENADFFADYEEMEDRVQRNVYSRQNIKQYVQHCREKALRIMSEETLETLAGASGFDWRKEPRAELHMYNIRHIQHHAAQMSLRLRVDAKVEIPWIGSGWRELPSG